MPGTGAPTDAPIGARTEAPAGSRTEAASGPRTDADEARVELAHDPVPLHRLDVPAPHVLPFAMGGFDAIGRLSRAAFPHRHTFYEIVYLTGGTGTHVIDARGWPLGPPHLCVLYPGQVHFWHRAAGLSGWVVLFEEAFLLAHPEDRELLRELSARPWLAPRGAAAEEIAAVLDAMAAEYRAGRPGMLSVLQAYLHILLVRGARLTPRTPSGPAESEVRRAAAGEPAGGGGAGRTGALAEEFARLVAAARPAEGAPVTVAEWAARLGVSAGHLHQAVKRGTGRTPGELIRQAQLLEAKRLLAGTELTVRRIARETGFADPAYFCRFFRREAGMTPGEFRRAAAGGVRDTAGLRIGMHHTPRDLSIEAPGPSA